jgi:hypothetical protein
MKLYASAMRQWEQIPSAPMLFMRVPFPQTAVLAWLMHANEKLPKKIVYFEVGGLNIIYLKSTEIWGVKCVVRQKFNPLTLHSHHCEREPLTSAVWIFLMYIYIYIYVLKVTQYWEAVRNKECITAEWHDGPEKEQNTKKQSCSTWTRTQKLHLIVWHWNEFLANENRYWRVYHKRSAWTRWRYCISLTRTWPLWSRFIRTATGERKEELSNKAEVSLKMKAARFERFPTTTDVRASIGRKGAAFLFLNST